MITVAACGSAQTPSHTTGSKIGSRPLAFANCMRAHGVPSFPDPNGGGGGVNLTATGINPQSPAFVAARKTCAGLTPGAVGGAHATANQFIAALRFSKCMRTHSFPTFPDPTRSDSPPGPILIVGPGLFFRVNQSFDPNTPQAARAMSGCSER